MAPSLWSQDEAFIQRLLADLHHAEIYPRLYAAEQFWRMEVVSPECRAALTATAAHDPNADVRQMARRALAKFGAPLPPEPAPPSPVPPPPARDGLPLHPKVDPSNNKRRRDFIIGFAGWSAIHAVLFVAYAGLSSGSFQPSDPGLFSWLLTAGTLIIIGLNGIAVVYLLRTRFYIALGALAAAAAVFSITIVAGIFLATLCFVLL
jgi:hypothetical protein